MAGDLIYAFRVMRLPLLDAGGATIGRIDDIVAIPGRAATGREPAIPPRIVGFVANSQHRRIFVNANRLAELSSDGARLRSWDVDLNPFKPRAGEVLIGADLIDHRTYAFVSDGDLMEGVSHETASIAGTLGLGKLIYLYDDNDISIEGHTDIAFTEDVQARFAAWGPRFRGQTATCAFASGRPSSSTTTSRMRSFRRIGSVNRTTPSSRCTRYSVAPTSEPTR